jgi:acid phosphatase family membrane protein YuiD
VAIFSWAVAQALKVVFNYWKKKKIDFRRLVGAGGMPSSHSAFVCSLATGVALREGWNSSMTALAICFAVVVMFDAAGVRYAAGQQAAILNKIVEEYSQLGRIQHKRLKELLGHTPFEVFVGALLGIAFALFFLA